MSPELPHIINVTQTVEDPGREEHDPPVEKVPRDRKSRTVISKVEKKGTSCFPRILHERLRPCLVHREKEILLADGRKLCIRSVRRGDEPALKRFFQSLSAETIFFRFGQWRLTMSSERLARLCCMNEDEDLAFLAFVSGDGGDIIGEVRLNMIPHQHSAELSFVVADEWQGQGVGGFLMDYALGVAKEIGLKKLVMEIMKRNMRMISFALKYHFYPLPGDEEGDMEEMQLQLSEGVRSCHSIQPGSRQSKRNGFGRVEHYCPL